MRMRQGITSVAVLIGLLALCCVYGCATKRVDNDPVKAPGLSPEEEAGALALFEDMGCNACHGDQAEGLEDMAPPLADLAPYWTAERLSTYILNPDWFRSNNPDFEERRQIEYDAEMPSYEEISEEDRILLARWLMTR
jgi:mono/diheme cytochrome c family protein